MEMNSNDYVTRVVEGATGLPATDWDDLLALQDQPTPFMRHAYLSALETSGSAKASIGWTPRFLTLWRGDQLEAACPLYLKDHSYGEYVFDWAWADAYQRHGLAYYPKALCAVPFTPVPGSRLLARSDAGRLALVRALIAWSQAEALSSLHLLFLSPADLRACEAAGLMARHTVQFHWSNRVGPGPRQGAAASEAAPGGGTPAGPYPDFDTFLGALSQDKRKKIRQERRKVAEAGITFRAAEGAEISQPEWEFFYRCYARTYREHGNPPYLRPAFFEAMASDLAESWVLFIAERAGEPIACSLVGVDRANGVAWGRYWGALERVDCLHFEACYYQPLQWCIANGFGRFEGGAQGEHKMARALMPVPTSSAHWLAHPTFSDAVQRFLEREGEGIEGYLTRLESRTPFKRDGVPTAD